MFPRKKIGAMDPDVGTEFATNGPDIGRIDLHHRPHLGQYMMLAPGRMWKCVGERVHESGQGSRQKLALSRTRIEPSGVGIPPYLGGNLIQQFVDECRRGKDFTIDVFPSDCIHIPYILMVVYRRNMLSDPPRVSFRLGSSFQHDGKWTWYPNMFYIQYIDSYCVL